MITIESAVRIVRQRTPELSPERIPAEVSAGRILSEDIVADTDLPPFDRSQMDGYAVIAAETLTAPVTLKIVGESVAGKGLHKAIKKGEAARIMTGAPVPRGADAVQRVELTSDAGFMQKGDSVTILEPVAKGSSIVRRGTEVKTGSVVVRKGERISQNNIAAIAAFGYAKVLVGKRPKVGILATGTEIVDISKKPGRDQIRNSNSIMLKALAEAAGADCRIFQPAGDDVSSLRSQFLRASRGRDILIITGGVSVGKYDLTKEVLTKLGAEISFEKLRLKPGKPVVFARLGQTLVFGLPGNPVSAAVTFYLLVRTAILLMQNARECELRKGTAILAADAKAAKDRDTFLPATLTTDPRGRLLARSLRSQGSSDLVGFAKAESLIHIPAGKNCKMGEPVEIRYL